MRIKTIIHNLVNAENYAEERAKVDDNLIGFVREHMGSYYDLIKEKEEAYQGISKLKSREYLNQFIK